jgi:hypothetical protein
MIQAQIGGGIVVEPPIDLRPFKELHALLSEHTLKSVVRIHHPAPCSCNSELSAGLAERYRHNT